jgi:hypothetical protein
MAVQAFTALTNAPWPLELRNVDAESGEPGGCVALDDLQAWLQEPLIACEARDQVWRLLAARVRSEDPAWVVGAVGVAAPRLRRITAALIGECAGDRSDVEAAVVSAFVEALRTISTEPRHVEQRLLWAAHRAGAWRMYAGEPPASFGAPAERPSVRFRAVLPDNASITHILT